jgi:hypothetical protein
MAEVLPVARKSIISETQVNHFGNLKSLSNETGAVYELLFLYSDKMQMIIK